MKVSRYMKDGKVRLARYVRYDLREPCADAAYPAVISYVQSCVDAVADTPAGLRVTIAGLSGSCTTDIDYARIGDFLCDAVAGSTVLNPDCPPDGWSYIETDLPPTVLQATVLATTLILPQVHSCEMPRPYEYPECLRDWWGTDGTKLIAVPGSVHELNFHGSAGFYPSIGYSFLVTVSCTGSVYARIEGVTDGYCIYIADVVHGSGSVPITADCAPIGTAVIPMYLDGPACAADCEWSGMGCADVGPFPEIPFYVGNLSINFARA